MPKHPGADSSAVPSHPLPERTGEQVVPRTAEACHQRRGAATASPVRGRGSKYPNLTLLHLVISPWASLWLSPAGNEGEGEPSCAIHTEHRAGWKAGRVGPKSKQRLSGRAGHTASESSKTTNPKIYVYSIYIYPLALYHDVPLLNVTMYAKAHDQP